MKSYTAFSLAIGVLLLGAVGLKIGLRGLNEAQGPDVKAKVVELALQRGYWVDRPAPDDSQLDHVSISQGFCKITVAFVSPLGWHRDSIKRSAAPGDRVVFIYRGRQYADQPLWETVSDHYRRRLGRLFGERAAPHPLLGVIASSRCPPESTTWLDQAADVGV